MISHSLILTGGSIDLQAASDYLKKIKWDFVIAADHGMDACKALKITPNLIMGDFDSASKETLEEYKQKKEILWEQFPSKKDETDTELALQKAIHLQSKEVTILGAFGTRMDHTLANLYLLNQALDADVDCKLVDAHNRVRMIKQGKTFLKSESFGKYISFFPFGGDVTHLNLTGFAYELNDFFLGASCIRGISNEFCKEEAKVEFASGRLLCIESLD
jgi:thiamine pyrophosphokinase